VPEPVVLHILEALEGGTARHVVDLVRHVPGYRHHVAVPRRRSVGVTDAAAAEQIRSAGGEVHRLDMRRLPMHPRNAAALLGLVQLTSRVQAHIVHGHSSVGGALARILPGRAARVYTPNGIYPHPAALALERALGRRTDRFVAVSPSEGEQALSWRLARPDQLVVIRNGVNLEPPPPIDLRRQAGIDPLVPLVGTVARLSAQKAPDVFVRTALRVHELRPEVVFVLVGNGPLAAEVDRLTAPLGMAFRRLPELPGAAASMGALDVFCLLSRFEGGPYAPLEAARAGVPLVLTDVVGSRDIVADGRSGRLVPAGDVAAATEAVLALLDNPAGAAAMVGVMWSRLADLFDVRRQGSRHCELYAALA